MNFFCLMTPFWKRIFPKMRATVVFSCTRVSKKERVQGCIFHKTTLLRPFWLNSAMATNCSTCSFTFSNSNQAVEGCHTIFFFVYPYLVLALVENSINVDIEYGLDIIWTDFPILGLPWSWSTAHPDYGSSDHCFYLMIHHRLAWHDEHSNPRSSSL